MELDKKYELVPADLEVARIKVEEFKNALLLAMGLLAGEQRSDQIQAAIHLDFYSDREEMTVGVLGPVAYSFAPVVLKENQDIQILLGRKAARALARLLAKLTMPGLWIQVRQATWQITFYSSQERHVTVLAVKGGTNAIRKAVRGYRPVKQPASPLFSDAELDQAREEIFA